MVGQFVTKLSLERKMFEWIERSIRDKIIKEIEDCIDYPEDDYERGLNRGMSIAINIIRSKK